MFESAVVRYLPKMKYDIGNTHLPYLFGRHVDILWYQILFSLTRW